MKFFSNELFKGIELIVLLFAPIFGSLLLYDSANKLILALIFIEAFVICILVLTIVQFVVRENETKNYTSTLQNKISDLFAQLTMANKMIEISKNSQPLYSSLSNIYHTRCIDGQKGFQRNGKGVDKAS